MSARASPRADRSGNAAEPLFQSNGDHRTAAILSARTRDETYGVQFCLVTEAAAAAIREVYEREGELSAAIELRRRFPGIQDNAKAREQARVLEAATTTASAYPGASESKGRPDGGIDAGFVT